jgi:hypothetical protein
VKRAACITSKAAFLASVCLGVVASGAFAADVNIRGHVGETLEGSDNYFLTTSPTGSTFRSLTTLNLDVLARTPGWRYLLSNNVSYYNYFGDGADQTSPKSGFPVHELFRVDHTTDQARYYATASWTRADLASTQLRESGVVTGTGTIDTLRAGGGVTYDINRIDAIAWTGLATHTGYTNSTTNSPYNDYATSLSWIRLLDPRTTWTTTLSFDWFDSSNLVSSQRLFWQIMTGVRWQLTRRLTVTASTGVGFVNGWNNGLVTPLPAANTFQTGATTSWQGLFTVNYQLLRTTNMFVSAAHLIVPTSDGHLQKTTTAGFGITHDINAWSKLFFATNYAHTAAGTNLLTSDADFFSATIGYSYRLARDWNSRIAYSYRVRDDSTGTATANIVLLSLVYNFNLLGKPTVFDPVDQQRALIRQQTAVGEVFPTLLPGPGLYAPF